MLDKHLQVKKHHFKVRNCKPVYIKTFGDLHYCSSFQDKKLTKIKNEILKSPTDYLIITGDLNDSTSYLYDNKEKRDTLIQWIESLSSQVKVFLTFGNHDFTYYNGRQRRKDVNEEFFEELKEIPNLCLSHYTPYYEDDSVIVCQLELDYDYYYLHDEVESVGALIEILETQKENMTNLDDEKLKVLVVHSPLRITHPKVLKYIKEFDLIIAGHMHNGLIPPLLTYFLPGNRGIVSPYFEPLTDNARRVKQITIDGHTIKLLITGGITKLQECAPFHIGLLNCLFTMQMDEISINEEQTLMLNKK